MADQVELEKRLAVLEDLAPRCAVRGCGKVAKGLCAEHEASWKKYQDEHPYEPYEGYIGQWETVRKAWHFHFMRRDWLAEQETP